MESGSTSVHARRSVALLLLLLHIMHVSVSAVRGYVQSLSRSHLQFCAALLGQSSSLAHDDETSFYSTECSLPSASHLARHSMSYTIVALGQTSTGQVPRTRRWQAPPLSKPVPLRARSAQDRRRRTAPHSLRRSTSADIAGSVQLDLPSHAALLVDGVAASQAAVDVGAAGSRAPLPGLLVLSLAPPRLPPPCGWWRSPSPSPWPPSTGGLR